MHNIEKRKIYNSLSKISKMEQDCRKDFENFSIEDFKKRISVSRNERDIMLSRAKEKIKFLYREHYLLSNAESMAHSASFYEIYIKAFSRYTEINTPYVAKIEYDSENAFSPFQSMVEKRDNKKINKNLDYAEDKFQESLNGIKAEIDAIFNSNLDYKSELLKIWKSLFETGNACIRRVVTDKKKMLFKMDFVELDKVLIYKDYLSNEVNEFYVERLFDYETFVKYFPEEYSISLLKKHFPNCNEVENAKVKNIKVIEVSKFFITTNETYVKYFLEAEDLFFLKDRTDVFEYQTFCYIQTDGKDNIYGKPYDLFSTILQELKPKQILAKSIQDKQHKLQNKVTLFLAGMPGVQNIETPALGGYQASLRERDELEKTPKAEMVSPAMLEIFTRAKPVDNISQTILQDLTYLQGEQDKLLRSFAQSLGLGEGFNRSVEEQSSQKFKTAYEINLREKQTAPASEFFDLIEHSSNVLYLFHFNFILGSMKTNIDKVLLMNDELQTFTKDEYVNTQMMTFDLWTTFRNTAEIDPEILKQFGVKEQDNLFYNFFIENEKNYLSIVEIAGLKAQASQRMEEIKTGIGASAEGQSNDILEELGTLRRAIEDYDDKLKKWAEYVDKQHKPHFIKHFEKEYDKQIANDVEHLVYSLGEDLIQFILFYYESNKKIKFTLTSTEANQRRNQAGNSYLQFTDTVMPTIQAISQFDPEEGKKLALAINFASGFETIAKAYNVENIVLTGKKLEEANEQRKEKEIEMQRQLATAQAPQENNEIS